MAIVDRHVRHLSLHPHPPNLKELPTVLPRFSGVSVDLPPFQPSHGPRSLYNDCKGSEADGPHKGSQTSPIPGRLAYQGPVPKEAQVNTRAMVDLTQSLGWIINQEKSDLKPIQVFSFVGY